MAFPSPTAAPEPHRRGDGGHEHGDHHAHGHAHGSGHHHHAHAGPGHHHHVPSSFGLRFAIGALINVVFVGAEAVYGLLGHSTALLADAGHNLSDVLGLLAAWGASRLARRRPTARFTYGLGSSSVLAALANGALLLIVTGMIAAEAVTRLLSPQAPAGQMVMLIAALGIAINGATAALFASGRHDLNARGAYLHMLSDAGVSAGVLVAGGLILLTGWAWLDPVVSLVIAALIVWGTWGLLREALNMALDGVPGGIDLMAVRAWLLGREGVAELHDLHIWAMSTTETALTCHLVTPRGHPGDRALTGICEGLREEFGIGHATLQVELGAVEACVTGVRHPEG